MDIFLSTNSFVYFNISKGKHFNNSSLALDTLEEWRKQQYVNSECLLIYSADWIQIILDKY